MLIRPARPEDAAAIAAIYGYYVRETVITFACTQPSAAQFADQIREGRYPFLVAEEGGAVLGFAYAHAYHSKEAFRWDVELTIYLRHGQSGRGIGSRLMGALLALLRRQGYLLAYSCITLPNPASLALHRCFGFTELGVFPRNGYKLGRWCDVIWLQCPLGEALPSPQEPQAFSSLSAAEVQQLISAE